MKWVYISCQFSSPHSPHATSNPRNEDWLTNLHHRQSTAHYSCHIREANIDNFNSDERHAINMTISTQLSQFNLPLMPSQKSEHWPQWRMANQSRRVLYSYDLSGMIVLLDYYVSHSAQHRAHSIIASRRVIPTDKLMAFYQLFYNTFTQNTIIDREREKEMLRKENYRPPSGRPTAGAPIQLC